MDSISGELLSLRKPPSYVAVDGSCATRELDREELSARLEGADIRRMWAVASPLTGAPWRRVPADAYA
jgi:hypothetical protein